MALKEERATTPTRVATGVFHEVPVFEYRHIRNPTRLRKASSHETSSLQLRKALQTRCRLWPRGCWTELQGCFSMRHKADLISLAWRQGAGDVSPAPQRRNLRNARHRKSKVFRDLRSHWGQSRSILASSSLIKPIAAFVWRQTNTKTEGKKYKTAFSSNEPIDNVLKAIYDSELPPSSS